MASGQARWLAPACLLAVALCLVPACPFVIARSWPRLPAIQQSEPRQAQSDGSESGMGGMGASTAFAMAAMTAFSAKVLRSKVMRQAGIVGWRDHRRLMEKNWEETPTKEERYRNYVYGQRGYKKNQMDPRWRDKAPARMKLSHVTEAMAIYKTQDFYRAEFAEMKAEDAKQVGSYQIKADGKTAIPATVPIYRPIKRRTRLEKEPGEKRPPVEDEAYVKYVDEKCNLYDIAKEAAPSALDKDIICDRGSLLTLLDFVSETLTPFLMKHGQHASPVDLVKISKAPSGKALVMEKLLDVDKMLAEHIPYRMGWKRTEVSNHGNFKPALQRVALGDRKTRSMMITGLQQIAGSRAGDLDECFRFVEFELGGLKFLTKARAFAQQGGKNVDVNHKNFYYQDEVKALSTYFKMLLGKADKNVLVLQRSGKLHQVVESTPESILEKQPMIKEAAARRFGRLVELLKKVQKEVDSADDGPWVLQWQAGQLILGKFELVPSMEEAVPA
ncbi:unnamed protein product [Effrenium voratum]|nr:unnamed protein product [Effrenium voratum]